MEEIPVQPQQSVIEPQPVKKPFFSKTIIAVFVIVIILILLPTGAYLFLNLNKQVACTTEAKICPDGSSVGRTGPKCEFTACPASNAAKATANWKTYTNIKDGFSFKYPLDWKLINKSETDINLYPPTSAINEPSPMIDFYSSSTAYETLEKPPMSSISSIMVDNIVGWQSEDQGPLLPHIFVVALPNKTGFLYITTDENLKQELKQILSTFKFMDQTSQIDTSNWKTYVSKIYNFSIKYPNDWTYDDSKDIIFYPPGVTKGMWEKLGETIGIDSQVIISLEKQPIKKPEKSTLVLIDNRQSYYYIEIGGPYSPSIFDIPFGNDKTLRLTLISNGVENIDRFNQTHKTNIKDADEITFKTIANTLRFAASIPPAPTCKPRPACLDATPRCMIAETSDMCPPTIVPAP